MKSQHRPLSSKKNWSGSQAGVPWAAGSCREHGSIITKALHMGEGECTGPCSPLPCDKGVWELCLRTSGAHGVGSRNRRTYTCCVIREVKCSLIKRFECGLPSTNLLYNGEHMCTHTKACIYPLYMCKHVTLKNCCFLSSLIDSVSK